MALLAQITKATEPRDARGSARRTVRLQVAASTARDTAAALVHDLSETGLRIETRAALNVGDTLDVELPRAGTVSTRVIWKRGRSFGCNFDKRVSKAVVSAALLLSPAKVPALTVGGVIPSVVRSDGATWVGFETENPLVTSSTVLGLALVVGSAVAACLVVALLVAS